MKQPIQWVMSLLVVAGMVGGCDQQSSKSITVQTPAVPTIPIPPPINVSINSDMTH